MFVAHQCDYDFHGNNFLERRRIKSKRYGTKSISFLAPKIWKILPNEIKDLGILLIFKAKIKKWKFQQNVLKSKICLPQVGVI